MLLIRGSFLFAYKMIWKIPLLVDMVNPHNINHHLTLSTCTREKISDKTSFEVGMELKKCRSKA